MIRSLPKDSFDPNLNSITFTLSLSLYIYIYIKTERERERENRYLECLYFLSARFFYEVEQF